MEKRKEAIAYAEGAVMAEAEVIYRRYQNEEIGQRYSEVLSELEGVKNPIVALMAVLGKEPKFEFSAEALEWAKRRAKNLIAEAFYREPVEIIWELQRVAEDYIVANGTEILKKELETLTAMDKCLAELILEESLKAQRLKKALRMSF